RRRRARARARALPRARPTGHSASSPPRPAHGRRHRLGKQATCHLPARARSAGVSRTCAPWRASAPPGDRAVPSQAGGVAFRNERSPSRASSTPCLLERASRLPSLLTARRAPSAIGPCPRLARASSAGPRAGPRAPSHAHVERAALAGLRVLVGCRIGGRRGGRAARSLALARRRLPPAAPPAGGLARPA